tara:strand:- start:1181 stop:2839 length:1659 start_codon:yes stop_codon:yes gene_type:complete
MVKEFKYDAKNNLIWLLLRPWILIPRVISIIFSISYFILIAFLLGRDEDQESQKRVGKILLKTISNLGPCFIKLGQSLSTRPDLVRQDWLEELTKLQDGLPPFSHKYSLNLIKKELGFSAQELFQDFPEEPIASASLGQVYKALLKDNYYVAVKIQRPDLEFIIRRDISIIRLICFFIAPILPLNLGVSLGEIIDEFGRSLFNEIDYLKEAENAIKFAGLFKNNPKVTIPKVLLNLTSKLIITTSWIDGTKLRDRKELEANRLNVTGLISTGVISGLQQLLEFGYFHADPHPGNMFALKTNTKNIGHIAYVDFGMMDSISDYDRLTLIGAIVHLINREYALLAKDFQALGFLSKTQDLTPIIPALEQVLGGSLGEEVASFNFKKITDKFSELMYKYPFRVPSRFALIIRAVVSQEGLALRLDPQFKIIGVAYPYVAKRLLTDNSAEIVNILADVAFDKKGNIKHENIESLLNVILKDSNNLKTDFFPIIEGAIKLLISNDGNILRKNLLMSLIKDDKINTSDLEKLIRLLANKFSPVRIVKDIIGTPLTINA